MCDQSLTLLESRVGGKLWLPPPPSVCLAAGGAGTEPGAAHPRLLAPSPAGLHPHPCSLLPALSALCTPRSPAPAPAPSASLP